MTLRTAFSIFLVVLVSSHLALAGAEEEKVTQAADGFCNAYVKYVNGFIERTDRSEKLDGPGRWRPYLTKGCYAAYRKVLKTPDLDYDPLLQSNNVPDTFAVQKVRMDGTTAWAWAKYVGYIATQPPLELRLKEVEGKWLMDAIGDLNK